MKSKELAGMGTGELQAKLEELYSSLMKDKAQSATGTPPKNTKGIRTTKKTIARILTILNKQKEVKQPEKK